MDKPAKEIVRELKVARMYLDAAKLRLDDATGIDDFQRAYPGPELREIRRKVVTGVAMIDEIIGDAE